VQKPTTATPIVSTTSSLVSALNTAMSGGAPFKALAAALGLAPDELARACARNNVVVLPPQALGHTEDLLTDRSLCGADDLTDAHRPVSGADALDTLCRLHRDARRALCRLGVDMSSWVIRSDSDETYWQEDDCGRTSWTGDIDFATVYYGFELPGKALPAAPTTGDQVSWVSLEIALATDHPEPALQAERG